ncbi:DUF4270 family protein [Winogradskyella sp. 3972H.M.0a.05]|uniref:DUF4270 domain-containing protein n=1 Tax=Winogradskyella sp. 3972H.M.0a.05 TaxID=2950277 RepID=UPI003391B07C
MKIAFKYVVAIGFIITTFIACDKDFASLDSDIINSGNASNFNTERAVYRDDVIAYTKKLGPAQTNTMPINPLGFYNDPVYGSTTYSFVTQLSSSLIDPDFGDEVELDSVVLTIPYFATNDGVDEDGNPVFILDSVYNPLFPIKLSIYENNYFLRDFDPNSTFDDPQGYFSNQSSSETDPISSTALEGTPIVTSVDSNVDLNFFTPNSSIIQLTDVDGNVTSTLTPSLRVKLEKEFWQQKILDMEGQPELSNSNNFNNYFRGLYFKAESQAGNGNLMLLNFGSTSANVTLYYTRAPFTEGADRDEVTYVLNFSGNKATFIESNPSFVVQDGDETNGDQNLFLKGGQGSIAEIKLFGGTDVDEDPLDDNIFETFKSQFVNVDEEGNYVSRKRLINEANLVVKLDETFDLAEENTRLYLYDAENNISLLDYSFDITNSISPFDSRTEHLGQLQTIENEQGQEEKVYKFNITQHIVNLLTNDSTNVKLGLSVSNNVNLEGEFVQPDVQLTPETTIENAPISSILSHRGTVLGGSAHPNENKRVFLEIFYTEPEN